MILEIVASPQDSGVKDAHEAPEIVASPQETQARGVEKVHDTEIVASPNTLKTHEAKND